MRAVIGSLSVHRPGTCASARAPVGASAGRAFVPVLTFAVGRQKQLNRRAWIALVFFIPACIQTSVEICFTNIAVPLSVIILGETSYPMRPANWPRWWEGCVALLKPLGRWLWLAREIRDH